MSDKSLAGTHLKFCNNLPAMLSRADWLIYRVFVRPTCTPWLRVLSRTSKRTLTCFSMHPAHAHALPGACPGPAAAWPSWLQQLLHTPAPQGCLRWP
jgi:hypothetical protein